MFGVLFSSIPCPIALLNDERIATQQAPNKNAKAGINMYIKAQLKTTT